MTHCGYYITVICTENIPFSECRLEQTLPFVAVVLTWWSVLAAESPAGAKDRGSSDTAGRCRVKCRAELRDHGCHSRNH